MASGRQRVSPHIFGRDEGVEVAEDGEEGEEGGEGVLAFGNPGDGFDAEGMAGPEEGEEDGGKGRGAAAAEDEVEEYGIQGMEEHVAEVEGPRIAGAGTENGDVEHPENPQEGGIHGGIAMESGESLPDGAEGETVQNQMVPGDEHGVVVIEQGIGDGRGEEGEGGKKHKKRRQEAEETAGRPGYGWNIHGGWKYKWRKEINNAQCRMGRNGKRQGERGNE